MKIGLERAWLTKLAKRVIMAHFLHIKVLGLQGRKEEQRGFEMDKRTIKALVNVMAMSNLPPEDTGVTGAVIWVSANGIGLKHGPRVKVIVGNKVSDGNLKNSVSVTITNPPKVLGDLPAAIKKDAVQWVTLNQAVLLDYWNNRISTREMMNSIIHL